MEYRQAPEICTSCGSSLAAEPSPDTPSSDSDHDNEENWIPIMRLRRQENAAIIQGLLESEGIEAEVIDKTLAQMPLPVSGRLSRVEIWVPETKADAARQLIEASEMTTTPCPKCGALSTSEETACESCGAPLAHHDGP